MRTDSVNLSKLAQGQILQTIESKFGKEFATPRVYKTKSKNAQEAHEAIRITDPSKENAGGNEEQKRLYRLIWQRTVSSQMPEAQLLKTKAIVQIGKGNVPDFSINGSRVLFDGWFLADPASKSEDVELPKLEVSEILDLLEMKTEAKQTQPPTRYSEAGLVKELEKRGVGRPSTYASIIKTILDRGYVEKYPVGSRSLKPTDTGDVVSSFLEEHFTKYISDSFTAEMEDNLDEIAEGKKEYRKTLEDFYTPFTKDITSKEDIEKLTNLGEADKKYKCPECKSSMVIKLGKTGKFISCAKFPDCTGALTIEGEKLEGPKETGEDCPDCKNKLIERDGKFGRFIACSNYPKCKYVKKDAELEKQNSTGVLCTECKKGYMMERRGRFGIFYSCTEYPKCKHIIKTKPTGNICDYPREDKGGKCRHLMMEGTKTIPERCSDKTCPNHNPHKLEKK
ncbi:DNA topoisomerase, partial [Patescibacteria group bacterium]